MEFIKLGKIERFKLLKSAETEKSIKAPIRNPVITIPRKPPKKVELYWIKEEHPCSDFAKGIPFPLYKLLSSFDIFIRIFLHIFCVIRMVKITSRIKTAAKRIGVIEFQTDSKWFILCFPCEIFIRLFQFVWDTSISFNFYATEAWNIKLKFKCKLF